MKYLKTFETVEGDGNLAIFLSKEITKTIKPILKESKVDKYTSNWLDNYSCYSREGIDYFEGEFLFDSNVPYSTEGYLDDNEIFEEYKTAKIHWDKLDSYMKKLLDKIPSLLPDYFTRLVEYEHSGDGWYRIELELSDNIKRSHKVGLWDLKK